jgi:hypothetical protein
MNEPAGSNEMLAAQEWPAGIRFAHTGGGIVKEPEFPDDSWVEVRYPLTSEQEHGDREAWPWLTGWVVSRCGTDEWEVCVQTPELASEYEGETVFPTCFRDSSELREASQIEREPEAGQ